METRFPTFRRLAGGFTFPTLRPVVASLWWPWRPTFVQQQALLRLIAVALEENLPLPPLLEQWADDETGWQRFRVRRFARLLAAGRPLVDAAEAVPGALREDDVLALRFDAQSGTRTAAIRASLEKPSATVVECWVQFRNLWAYLGTVLPLSLLVILFVQVRITPLLERTFQSYGAAPPPLVGWLHISDGAALTLFGGGALWLLLLTWLFGTQAGRRTRWALASRWLRSIHELRSADVLQKLRVAANAGRPLSGALSTLARYHFDPRVRHELLVVRNDLEQGTPVWQSMSAVGLLSPAEANLLTVADDQGSPAVALDQLVDVKRERVARRLQNTGEFLLPAVVLLLAVLVILQACSVFVPLLQVMEGLQ